MRGGGPSVSWPCCLWTYSEAQNHSGQQMAKEVLLMAHGGWEAKVGSNEETLFPRQPPKAGIFHDGKQAFNV